MDPATASVIRIDRCQDRTWPPAITRVTAEPVRQFLSSSDVGQEVPGDGCFARIFVKAREGRRRIDANGDGYLTRTENGERLTYEIANLSRAAQTLEYRGAALENVGSYFLPRNVDRGTITRHEGIVWKILGDASVLPSG